MEIKNNGIVQEVNGRIVTGYLSSFGNIDSDNDIMQKGAFSKSISERKNDIFFLNQHNWKQPLAKFAVLQEDEKGLYFETEPIANTSYGNDALELYKSGIVKEHSIGFQTLLSDMDMKSGVRTLKEVKLYEGSCVTLGANDQTPFLGLKSKDIEAIQKALRSGNFTDEMALQLESQLKALQLSLSDIKKPLKDTLDIKEPKNVEEIKQILQSFKL